MPKYKKEELADIHARTDGRCHLCGGDLNLHDHGHSGWHVEHDIPRAHGGSNDLDNLYPAHAPCNLAKGTLPSELVRDFFGRSGAPLARDERVAGTLLAGAGGGVLGAMAGSVLGQVMASRGEEENAKVAGAVLGGLLGALFLGGSAWDE